MRTVDSMSFVIPDPGQSPRDNQSPSPNNVFRIMNMKRTPEKQISDLFQSLSALPRLQMVQALKYGEACVCHLETMLGYRQAYISQHLMALRKAGVVVSRREGRNVFYRLANPDLADFLRQAGRYLGISDRELEAESAAVLLTDCPCPHCDDDKEPASAPKTTATP
jgi:ArsR family transcriptional regulator